jgi:hypothetical protein
MMIGVDADSQELQFYVAAKFQTICGKCPVSHLLGTLVMGELSKRKRYQKIA